jgi:hypothetical protein
MAQRGRGLRERDGAVDRCRDRAVDEQELGGNVASMGVDADEVFRREIDAPVFETPPTG